MQSSEISPAGPTMPAVLSDHVTANTITGTAAVPAKISRQ